MGFDLRYGQLIQPKMGKSGLGKGWNLCVGDYFAEQLTNDKQFGASIPNSKTRGTSIGPNVEYDSGEGWFLTAKWEQEMSVKNGTDDNAFWLKRVFPF